MNSSTSISKGLRFLTGLAIAFGVMELTLRALPVFHFPQVIAPTLEFRHNPPGKSFQLSTGWRMKNVERGHFNNYGFRSETDFAPGQQAIALIGNSFVEGITTHYSATLAVNLSAKLPAGNDTVFAFGYAGNTLFDHLKNIELAHGELVVETIVVLITSIDISTSWQEPEHWGHYYDLGSDDDKIRFKRLNIGALRAALERFSLTSALFSYVRYNLQPHGHINRWMASLSNTSRDPEMARRNDIVVIDRFVNELGQIPGLDLTHLLFVFDANREALRAGEAPTMGPAEDYLLKAVGSAGARTLDLTPYFERHDMDSDGSYDYLPIDSHWTEIGKDIATRAIADTLQQPGAPDATP